MRVVDPISFALRDPAPPLPTGSLDAEPRSAGSPQPAAAVDANFDAADHGGGHAGHGRDDGAVFQRRTESDDVDVSDDDAGLNGHDV